ncbi:hypothetical protein TruAng_006890 [Truncatella angustata]|nr:hypothetical protein TruAng_006890 [Truncatella angustata]
MTSSASTELSLDNERGTPRAKPKIAAAKVSSAHRRRVQIRYSTVQRDEARTPPQERVYTFSSAKFAAAEYDPKSPICPA